MNETETPEKCNEKMPVFLSRWEGKLHAECYTVENNCGKKVRLKRNKLPSRRPSACAHWEYTYVYRNNDEVQT